MNSILIEAMRNLGESNALALRNDAAKMSGTQIIAQEYCVPSWSADKDYSAWPIGSPVSDNGQVWVLIQPHNAANYNGHPEDIRSLWGLCHTTDPTKAKPWIDAYGTSGMYMKDEYYKDIDGVVHRCRQDNTVHDAAALPDAWEVVTP